MKSSRTRLAKQEEPLRVPAGADLPDTRNALKIPELKSPELPAEPGSCLEHPPSDGDRHAGKRQRRVRRRLRAAEDG